MVLKYDTYSLLDYPSGGNKYGNFTGSCPSRAAKKFISLLSKQHNFTNSSSKKAIICMIINNRTKKEYKYVGTRVKLHKPDIIYINNKKVSFNYKNIVAPYKDFYDNKVTGGYSPHDEQKGKLTSLHYAFIESSKHDSAVTSIKANTCFTLPNSKSLLGCH